MSGKEAVSDPERSSRRRPLRWPWMTALGGLACLTLAQLVPSPSVGPMLLIVGIDANGWAYLIRVAAGLLGTVAMPGLACAGLRGRGGLVSEIAPALLTAVLACWCCAAGPLALLVGVFTFDSQYRSVGEVRGRPVVVRLTEGWRGAVFLDAGLARGVWVDLRATNTGGPVRFPPPLSRWRFSVQTTPTEIRVNYSADGSAAGRGVLTLARGR